MKKFVLVALFISTLSFIATAQPHWEDRPGGAKDIGVGADGSVWIIGTSAVPGGYGIWKYTGTDWQRIEGGAVRIAVDPQGNAWCINSEGLIFHRVNNSWVTVPGNGKDIGVGADGTVWMVGNEAVPGGYAIWKWTGADWQRVEGGAVRIAVDPNGLAWCVNSEGVIFCRVLNGTVPAWATIPGSAKDVGVGANGFVWIVGTTPSGKDYAIYQWTVANFKLIQGGGTNISVGPNGLPWLINSNGSIFEMAATTSVKVEVAVSDNINIKEVSSRVNFAQYFSFNLFEVTDKKHPTGGFPTCSHNEIKNVTVKFLNVSQNEKGRVFSYAITSPDIKISYDKEYVLDIKPTSRIKLTPQSGFYISNPIRGCNGVHGNGSVLKSGFSGQKIL